MPLGKEVGLGPGRIVLDGDPDGTVNNLNRTTVWATVCRTVRPMLSDRCLSCPVLLYMSCPICPVLSVNIVGAQQPLHTFRPMSIVAKRSPISATAELLSV